MLDAFKSNDRPLRVQRVRYYRVPRYPAHTDPDPTLAPEAVPYPWKGSVMAAVVALSEAGCSKSETEESSADAPSSKKPLPALEAKVQKQIDEIVDAVLREQPEGKKNPFAQKLGLSGLPYVSSPYGTGAPTPLSTEIAQDLIARIFKAEGLEASPTTFAEKDLTGSVDGFDKEKRIGFVIGNWDSLDQTAFGSWMSRELLMFASGESPPVPPNEEAQVRDYMDRSAKWLFERVQLNEDQKAELTAAIKLESLQEKAKAYVALLRKLEEAKLSMDEIELAENQAEAHQRYLAIISVFDQRFQITEYDPKARDRFEALNLEAEKIQFGSADEKAQWYRKQHDMLWTEMSRQRLMELARSVREYIAWARRSGIQ
jgi:hypothetical protein